MSSLLFPRLLNASFLSQIVVAGARSCSRASVALTRQCMAPRRSKPLTPDCVLIACIQKRGLLNTGKVRDFVTVA
jgi:hypothetical protein